ncbi:MAG: hypothetical protein IKW97_03560 [Muribaculaceae bacterium]|nr:hypothetical protein [Muribaculaceae bacterium]
MNTVNQTFDWSRFTAALRKELVENKRAILFTLLGTFGMLTMIMILGNISVSTSTDASNAIKDSLENYLPQKMVYAFLSFAILIVASLAFRKLTSKTGRIEMFTSPSSTLEKFLVNALIYVIGYIVAFFICAQLADLTRIAALWFFRNEYFIVPGPINFLNLIPDAVDGFGFGMASPGNPNKWLAINIYIGLLAGPGLFLLGSILWPRLSLLKTFAAVYGFETILGIIIMIVAFNIKDMEAVGFWVMNHLEDIMIAMTIFAVVQAILYWGLSWYLFKRKDVVSLKWWK